MQPARRSENICGSGDEKILSASERKTSGIGNEKPPKERSKPPMPRRNTSPDAPYQSIAGASRLTSLAQGFIREGCKAGTIPHIMCGGEYRICMPLFFQSLEAESAASMKGVNT